jgi:hypothetical protein
MAANFYITNYSSLDQQRLNFKRLKSNLSTKNTLIWLKDFPDKYLQINNNKKINKSFIPAHNLHDLHNSEIFK